MTAAGGRDAPALPAGGDAHAWRYFLDAFYGAPNIGDEALCDAVVSGLLRELPFAEFTVATRNRAASEQYCSARPDWLTGWYPQPSFWRSLPRRIAAIARSDLVVHGGGGTYQDVHGWSLLGGLLLTAGLGLLLGRPLVTAAIGAGPLRRLWLRRWVRRVLRHAVLVTVRDEASRDCLVDCGIERDRIVVTADPVIGWVAAAATAGPQPAAAHEVGLAIRPHPDLNEAAVAALIERLAAGGDRVTLLGYELPDEALALRLRPLLSPAAQAAFAYEPPHSVAAAIAAVRRMRALIAMRLHANVFAAGLGVPTIALSYDSKVSSFMAQAGLSAWTRAVTSAGPGLADELKVCVAWHAQNASLMRERFASLARESRRTFDLIAKTPQQRFSIAARLVGGWAALAFLSLGLWSQFVRPFRLLRRILFGATRKQ